MIATEPQELAKRLVSKVEILAASSARCDAMCLTSGTQLSEAVPGLYELSGQAAALSTMLIDAQDARPAQKLETVVKDLMETGAALIKEMEVVADLINLNTVLTLRIDGLVDNVRFLSSVVSNVKIEIAAINEDDLRLKGFAESLHQLASKSATTVKAFQATHQMLIKRLEITSKNQAAFVSSHGATFAIAAREISASLGAVSDRRRTISVIASEIGEITHRMGSQIAQCVVGLQVGDSTRQCLEHASDGLSTAIEVLSDVDPQRVVAWDPFGEGFAERDWIAGQICQLQVLQIAEATKGFSTAINTAARLIEQIGDGTSVLLDKSQTLVSPPATGSKSFLEDLQSKLALAGDLINECSPSRKLVDDTAEQVIASVVDLRGLAHDVAGMATDMMIIGTNAVVTSYRLGTKGIPLSVIAQHLRSHAVLVTDAVRLVGPALDKVLEAAKHFTLELRVRDSSSMRNLSTCIMEALGAFQAGDLAVVDIHNRLEGQISAAAGILKKVSDTLREVGDFEAQLMALCEEISSLTAANNTSDSATFPASLDLLLRERYTMGSERAVHNSYFPTATLTGRSQRETASNDSLWL